MRRLPLLLLALTAAAPLPADTAGKTASGATFTAPRSWSEAAEPAQVVLATPEPGSRIALVDIASAVDAKAATAAAWRLSRPDFARRVKVTANRAPRNGWDEQVLTEYETSPNEHAEIEAIAFRHGGHWVVALIDGSEAVFEKRAGAASLVIQSLRPAGYVRESFAGRTPHPFDAGRLAALQDFLRVSMAALDVPGVGLAVAQQGRVIFEGGLGVRELGKPQQVDAHTRFMIASNTKGMSTLLLAKLVDRNKMHWDEKVVDVYPPFRLGSAATTQTVEMKHLVCACTGLPRKDYEIIFDTNRDTPASETFSLLASTEPTSQFGEVFQYNNLMAAAAGYIGGHVFNPDRPLKAGYEAAMRAQIFAPLGMDDTGFDMAAALGSDHASPHADDIDGVPRVGSMDFNYVFGPYEPAGGAWSSAHDMIRYVQDELSEGTLPDGTVLVSAKNLLQRRVPNVATGEDESYGMGLEINTHWGVAVVHHGGSLAGFKSDWVAIPSAGVGAVLLTNGEWGGSLTRPFMRRMLELLYDGKPEASGDVAAAAARLKAEMKKDRVRLAVPPAIDAAQGLAAHYTSPELGTLAVTRTTAGVTFDFGAWRSAVASRHNDDGTTSFITIDPLTQGFEFVVGTDGGKRVLVIRDGQHRYVYREA